MILFHQRLPCSDNFFRYFKNYDKYMEEKKQADENTRTSQATGEDSNGGDSGSMLSQLSKSPVRTIESPKYGLALSPIQKFMKLHSPKSATTQASQQQ